MGAEQQLPRTESLGNNLFLPQTPKGAGQKVPLTWIQLLGYGQDPHTARFLLLKHLFCIKQPRNS